MHGTSYNRGRPVLECSGYTRLVTVRVKDLPLLTPSFFLVLKRFQSHSGMDGVVRFTERVPRYPS